MIDFTKTDIRNFNEAAQKIIAGSDNEALKDLFAGCETVEDANAAANDLCVKVWDQDFYVYINEDDITEYKTDDLYYEQAYQLDDGRWIAYDEAVNAWVMLG